MSRFLAKMIHKATQDTLKSVLPFGMETDGSPVRNSQIVSEFLIWEIWSPSPPSQDEDQIGSKPGLWGL